MTAHILQRNTQLGVSTPARIGKVVENVVTSGYFPPELSDVLFEEQGPVKGDAKVHWVRCVLQFFPFSHDSKFSRCSLVV